jgi:hypothetical protein
VHLPIWRNFITLPWNTARFCIWVFILAGSILGAFIASFLNPGKFWAAWETTGLSFTILYSVTMVKVWWWGSPKRHELPVNQYLKDDASGTFWICQIIMILALSGTAWVAWHQWPNLLHAFLLVVISAASFTAQLQIRDHARDHQRLNESYSTLQNEAKNTIQYSEIPTLVTFGALFIFVFLTSFPFSRISNGYLESFIGGSVSFQLLLSNIIFGINYALPRLPPNTKKEEPNAAVRV